MSYISTLRRRDEVFVWERTEKGRELVRYPAPYYLYIKDPKGEHESIYGDKLRRYDFNNRQQFEHFRSECYSSGIELFESDIPSDLKILSKHYYGIKAPNLHVTLLDIEVDYKPEVGFASVSNPYAPINSIAMYHNWTNRMVIYAVPPENFSPVGRNLLKELDNISPLPTDTKVEVHLCKDEKELLKNFLKEIEDSDLLSGWNSDFFDVPYLGARLKKLGQRYFRELSFPEADEPKWRDVVVMGNTNTTLDLKGRISCDYMVLFRKYEQTERPSYKLESIADEILPDLPKLEYEGSLAELYRKNFLWFIRYNLRDTEIIKGFEERLGYIDLANQMYHISAGTYQHVTGTLKLAELAVINYCHNELGGLIVNDNITDTDDDRQIKGAFVLLPQVGLHEWLGAIDLKSLYPTGIRSVNISPETLLGQFDDNVEAAKEIVKRSMAEVTLVFDNQTHIEPKLRGRAVTATADEWATILENNKWSISGYGTVFNQNKKGIIPTILEDWYATRKKYQKMKYEAEAAGDSIKETYYDKLQYIYKIKLNSFYGALNNKFFRFYDLRMGESTTGTGRMILIHQCAKVCEILDGEYVHPDRKEKDDKGKLHFGYSEDWSVIYGDTDSSYFETHAKNQREATLIADRVGKLVDASFPDFMRKTFLCSEGFDTLMGTEREIISDRGIFVDKKRYILHIVDKEGHSVDKMKVMGLDTKKTTLPKQVSKVLNSFIERYLKGEDWDVIANDIVEYKEHLSHTDNIMLIGLPKGINKLEYYTEQAKIYGKDQRLPGHVAAAIHYNLALKKFKDTRSMPITSGMKIKVFYLTKEVGRFKSIAIPVDIEEVPQWFLDHYGVNVDAHIQRLVDNPLKNILKAIKKEVPSKQSLYIDSMLEF